MKISANCSDNCSLLKPFQTSSFFARAAARSVCLTEVVFHLRRLIQVLLFSLSLRPPVSFGRSDTYRKRVQICGFLLFFVALFSALAVLFYVYPIKCDWCEFLTCIPVTDQFCEKYDLNAHLH